MMSCDDRDVFIAEIKIVSLFSTCFIITFTIFFYQSNMRLIIKIQYLEIEFFVSKSLVVGLPVIIIFPSIFQFDNFLWKKNCLKTV